MVTWDNLDTLASFQNLSKTGRVDLKKVMSGAVSYTHLFSAAQ